MVDPYRTHRVQSWWVERLTSDDASVGVLDGVTGGDVEINANRPIRGTGHLALDDIGQGVDFLADRVQVWWQVRGADPFPLGVFLMSVPRASHTDAGRSWDIELFDKLTVLAEDGISASHSLPAGTVVTDAVKDVILSTGETALAVTDSTETLATGKVWPAGTSKLTIVNDLLALINYFSLRCDGYGRYVAAPYMAPALRSRVWDFTAGDLAVHLPEFDRTEDLSGIPNTVVIVSSGTGDDEALVGVAVNDDPASRFSTVARGRTITATEENVDATSQAVIDALAERRLESLSRSTATIDIEHEVLPLAESDAARFDTDGVRASAVVEKFRLTLAEDALMSTTIREVSG